VGVVSDILLDCYTYVVSIVCQRNAYHNNNPMVVMLINC
jgi:hypothetical protein